MRSEKYILITDEEYMYIVNIQNDDYKTLEGFEKIEFEKAKKNNIDIEEYENDILQSASDNYWDYVYNHHMGEYDIIDLLNSQEEEITSLKSINMGLEDANAGLEEIILDLENENEELKSRNKAQYKQLKHLQELIEEKDWKTLTKEHEQIKEEDKRLQELESIPVRCMRIWYGDE